jgi:hypothetical protein
MHHWLRYLGSCWTSKYIKTMLLCISHFKFSRLLIHVRTLPILLAIMDILRRIYCVCQISWLFDMECLISDLISFIMKFLWQTYSMLKLRVRFSKTRLRQWIVVTSLTFRSGIIDTRMT